MLRKMDGKITLNQFTLSQIELMFDFCKYWGGNLNYDPNDQRTVEQWMGAFYKWCETQTTY